MTGRDVIMLILQLHMEDDPIIFTKHELSALVMTREEAAVKFAVGLAVIDTWIHDNRLATYKIDGEYYISKTAKDPRRM